MNKKKIAFISIGIFFISSLLYAYILTGKDVEIINEMNVPAKSENELVMKKTDNKPKVPTIPSPPQPSLQPPIPSPPKTKSIITSDNQKEGVQQVNMPDFLLNQTKVRFENDNSSPDLAVGFNEDGKKELSKDNLEDSISADNLPPLLSKIVKSKLKFRKENGYDEVKNRTAKEKLSVVERINGADIPTPLLSFTPSQVPKVINDNYQYLGYVYPYQTEESVLYSSVKRVFQNYTDNSILVLEETSLKNGSATVTKEFVNATILKCPAIIIQKKSKDEGQYGQINWNTRKIGYVLYQFNKENSIDGLIQFANIIASVNKDYTNCNEQEDKGSTPVPLTN